VYLEIYLVPSSINTGTFIEEIRSEENGNKLIFLGGCNWSPGVKTQKGKADRGRNSSSKVWFSNKGEKTQREKLKVEQGERREGRELKPPIEN